MKVVCLDIESFFDSKTGYTLRRMSTEEYCRDPRFKMHMCSFWIPSEMPGGPVVYTPDMIQTHEGIRRTIETSAVMAFHAHFDLLALNHWYGLRPAFVLDPLCMARLLLPRLKSHSLESLAAHFGLGTKSVPYNEFDGVRHLSIDLYSRLADGCAQDTRLMWSIFQKLAPAVPPDEMKVISSTVKMFTEPCLRLDRPRMSAFLKAEKIRKAKAMLAAGDAVGLHFVPWIEKTGPSHAGERLKAHLDQIETELQSSAKFQIALEALGYPCPMKWSEKAAGICTHCLGACNPLPEGSGYCETCTGTGKIKGGFIPALAKSDDGMKELLEHDDSRVQALAAARLGVKSTIDETRAERLLSSDGRGSLPVYLSYAAAKTLRFGGGDKTNWQNFRRGGEIRKSIRAPEGHKLVIADAAQVECRGVNWLAGEQWVLDAFAEGRDVYSETASRNLGRHITKADVLERFGGKTLELGCGFGLGWSKYQRQMRAGMLGGPSVILTDEEAQRGVRTYRETHPNVVALWNLSGKQMLPALASGAQMTYKCLRIADHRIYLPNGSFLDYSGLYWGYYGDQPEPEEKPQWWHPGKKGKVKYYGGKLVENYTQALYSGLLIREAMNVIATRYKIVLQVHDEIVCAVPDAEVDEAEAFMKAALCKEPTWCPGIPLSADVKSSEIYDK